MFPFLSFVFFNEGVLLDEEDGVSDLFLFIFLWFIFLLYFFLFFGFEIGVEEDDEDDFLQIDYFEVFSFHCLLNLGDLSFEVEDYSDEFELFDDD